MESIKAELTNGEWNGSYQRLRNGRMGKMLVKGYTCAIIWWINPRDLMISIVVILNITALNHLKLIRDQILNILTTRKHIISMWRDGGVNQCPWWSSYCNIWMCKIRLYTLNFHNVICQWYPQNKPEYKPKK